jgi:hypothetical protein
VLATEYRQNSYDKLSNHDPVVRDILSPHKQQKYREDLENADDSHSVVDSLDHLELYPVGAEIYQDDDDKRSYRR